MGTRHLTAVVLDGQFRIAQYGQWDGYPSGQGKTALEFVRSMDRSTFETKLRAMRFASKADLEAIDAEVQASPIVDGGSSLLAEGGKYQQFSRDRGAKILALVANADPGIQLHDMRAFAADSLFCEWAYVIDLDKNRFEVYQGFNKTPLGEGDRFKCVEKHVQKRSEYQPIRLLKSYDLLALPPLELFLAELEPEEEEA